MEYMMVEGNTADIGGKLTELSKEGWNPIGSHQSFIKVGSYSKHSVLLYRLVQEQK